MKWRVGARRNQRGVGSLGVMGSDFLFFSFLARAEQFMEFPPAFADLSVAEHSTAESVDFERFQRHDT
jgi:hypothetical protein